MKSRGSNSFHGIGYAWLLVTIFCLSSTTSHTFNYSSNNSTYVEKCRADCASHKDLISCGKFRVVRWLNDIAREKVGFVQVFFFCFNFIVEYSNSEYISKFLSSIQNIKRESLIIAKLHALVLNKNCYSKISRKKTKQSFPQDIYDSSLIEVSIIRYKKNCSGESIDTQSSLSPLRDFYFLISQRSNPHAIFHFSFPFQISVIQIKILIINIKDTKKKNKIFLRNPIII